VCLQVGVVGRSSSVCPPVINVSASLTSVTTTATVLTPATNDTAVQVLPTQPPILGGTGQWAVMLYGCRDQDNVDSFQL